MSNESRAKLLACTDPHVAYRNPFLEVHHSHATFEGFDKDYYVIKFKRRAGVVAVRAGCVLMVRQYRFLMRGSSWELPGGTVEASESFESGLRRECNEETGVFLRTLVPLVEYYPGLDNVDNHTRIFACEDAEIVRPFTPNPAEIEAIDWMPAENCLELVFAGKILDAMTVAGLLAYFSQMMRNSHERRP